MSDSIKKWHEMQEERATQRIMYPGDIFVTEYVADSTDNSTNYIYESPDGGNTVTKRAFGSNEKTVVKAPFTLSNTNEHIGKIMHSNLDEMKKQSKKTTKEAYKILAYHNIEAIELALDIAKENELS